jgi:hypothetical protein
VRPRHHRRPAWALPSDGGGRSGHPTELAERRDTERYIREWLNAQAAGGYVTYDAASGRYTLPAEQALALADETSPAFVPGLFQVTQAMWNGQPKIEDNFRTGKGLEWGHQHPCLFEGTERFFRSGYIGNLTSAWLPALEGVGRSSSRARKSPT